jgi:hypothetical protein
MQPLVTNSDFDQYDEPTLCIDDSDDLANIKNNKLSTLHLNINTSVPLSLDLLIEEIVNIEQLESLIINDDDNVNFQKNKTTYNLLAKMVAKHSSFKMFGLMGNKIGATMMCKYFLGNLQIKYLCLSNSGIGDNGLKMVVNSANFSLLEYLDFAFTDVSDEGLGTLTKASCGNLRYIDLAWCDITTDGIKAWLWLLLAKYAKLQFIALYDNKIDDRGSIILVEASVKAKLQIDGSFSAEVQQYCFDKFDFLATLFYRSYCNSPTNPNKLESFCYKDHDYRFQLELYEAKKLVFQCPELLNATNEDGSWYWSNDFPKSLQWSGIKSIEAENCQFTDSKCLTQIARTITKNNIKIKFLIAEKVKNYHEVRTIMLKINYLRKYFHIDCVCRIEQGGLARSYDSDEVKRLNYEGETLE